MGAERSLDQLVPLLPAGALDVARSWRPWAVDDATLATELLLPLVVEPDWPGPVEPRPVGDGWVQADLTDEDLDTFDRLRATLPGTGPEELAAAAQEWRLPVLPYRPLPTGQAHPDRPRTANAPRAVNPPSLEAIHVLDLSSLWAGPLSTHLLQTAGATVTKLDPDCRPDGFRERPNLYRQLNDGKKVVSLDLRQPDDRATFEALVRDADLLIHSFSRRVMPNLGYDHEKLRTINPTLTTVAISAFPLGSPEQDWLAYGSGIHAVTGLGLSTGRARPSAVAYPDPLTGYAAASAALRTVGTPTHTEVALATAGFAVAHAQIDRLKAGADRD